MKIAKHGHGNVSRVNNTKWLDTHQRLPEYSESSQEHIHLDIIVMQYSQGYRYCLTCVAALDNKYRYTTLSNGHGSEVVSALGFERSGPGFDSWRPWSYFSATTQNKRIISSAPAAISTAGNYYYRRRQHNATHISTHVSTVFHVGPMLFPL